jgi:hypothetical protein
MPKLVLTDCTGLMAYGRKGMLEQADVVESRVLRGGRASSGGKCRFFEFSLFDVIQGLRMLR